MQRRKLITSRKRILKKMDSLHDEICALEFPDSKTDGFLNEKAGYRYYRNVEHLGIVIREMVDDLGQESRTVRSKTTEIIIKGYGKIDNV